MRDPEIKNGGVSGNWTFNAVNVNVRTRAGNRNHPAQAAGGGYSRLAS
ncbi:hypothetical protein [Brevundimonas sp.]